MAINVWRVRHDDSRILEFVAETDAEVIKTIKERENRDIRWVNDEEGIWIVPVVTRQYRYLIEYDDV